MASNKPLKLLGRETKEIVTISGLVQDAIFVPADMTIDAQSKRFVAVLNRFQWEHAERVEQLDAGSNEDARFQDDIHSGFTRSFSALTVEGITGARTKGLLQGSRDQFLSIMALVPDENGLSIVCAGDAAIRLSGKNLRVYMEDLGAPWPTQRKPEHDDDLAALAAEAPKG